MPAHQKDQRRTGNESFQRDAADVLNDIKHKPEADVKTGGGRMVNETKMLKKVKRAADEHVDIYKD